MWKRAGYVCTLVIVCINGCQAGSGFNDHATSLPEVSARPMTTDSTDGALPPAATELAPAGSGYLLPTPSSSSALDQAPNRYLAQKYLDAGDSDEKSGTAGTDEAQEPSAASNDTKLAEAAQNPVAKMISVPFQFNVNFPTGRDRNTAVVCNIQPVIPFTLNKDWNLITRTILPVNWADAQGPGQDNKFGLGDLTTTGFFSPANSGSFIWGAGPVLLFPTATNDVFGTGKYCAGPAAVILKIDTPWVYGALAQQLWSYAGDSDRRSVNQTLIQPFVNYNLAHGMYLVSSPIITANWMASGRNVWTLPLGAGVGQILRLGKLPVNMSLHAYYNALRPDFGPDWTIRFQVQFLFPK